MRYMGLLDTYKSYLPVNDRNIAIKRLSGSDPMVVEDSEHAVMEAIRKLEG